jgi:hypothetical protein
MVAKRSINVHVIKKAVEARPASAVSGRAGMNASAGSRNIEGCLRSAGHNLLNTDTGFLVPDKAGVGGGDRDKLLVWLPREMFPGKRFVQPEPALLSRLGHDTERHPGARYTILVESLEGICWNFTEIVSARGIKIRIPVRFFDAPFRVEESPETLSLIKLLRNVSGLSSRVPQPYSQQRDDGKHIRSSRRAPFARAHALRFVHSPVQSGLASRRIEYSS